MRRGSDAEKVAGVGETRKRDAEWDQMVPRGQGAVAAPTSGGFNTSASSGKKMKWKKIQKRRRNKKRKNPENKKTCLIKKGVFLRFFFNW